MESQQTIPQVPRVIEAAKKKPNDTKPSVTELLQQSQDSVVQPQIMPDGASQSMKIDSGIPFVPLSQAKDLAQEAKTEVLTSLGTPIFQWGTTTVCWFFSILHGIYKAGWIRELFVGNVIRVVKLKEGEYQCTESGRTVTVELEKGKGPLWQQILVAFINDTIDKSEDSDLVFNKTKIGLLRIKSMAIPIRHDLKSAVESLLKTIYKGWKVEDAQSIIPSKLTKDDSPFKGMVGKTYLTPSVAAGKEMLEVMTVEKKGHAMGVESVDFGEEEIPVLGIKSIRNRAAASSSAPVPHKKTGVKISNLVVFNQSFSEDNKQKYQDVVPTFGYSGKVSAVTTGDGKKDWAGELDSFNYYKISRPSPLLAPDLSEQIRAIRNDGRSREEQQIDIMMLLNERR